MCLFNDRQLILDCFVFLLSMPHDIFISYSSKDKEKADQLSELLTSAGLAVWIDQSGIDLATSWSGEIVDAIEGCKAFVVLLSPNSIESHNVIKEVSLAAEKKKKILPIDLEPVALSRDLQYHLAGIQRAPIMNIDTIIRALGKLGLQATQAPTLKLVKESDSRKSLMILPFQDLSPTGDNSWFADGIVSELIQALSNVKSLLVTDAQTTKDFKRYQGTLPNYAKEMRVRYFVEGDVRKFGDQIKVNSRLLDIETGDHLWQDSLKGTMDDIFDIQETVAKKVVDGLHIILTKEEEEKVAKKPTENAEAYELYLKGNEYYIRTTRSDYDRALLLYEEALRLDSGFTDMHLQIANTSLEYYRTYSRDEKWITKASDNIAKAESVLGESARVYWIRSNLVRCLGKYEEALHLAKLAAKLAPDYALAYDAIGFACSALGRKEESVDARKKLVQLRENDRSAHFSYLIALNELGDNSRLSEAARNALPIFERYLRLTPEDVNARVQYAGILGWAGDHGQLLLELERIEEMEGLDAAALFNLACVFLHEGKNKNGLSLLRKSVERGFRDIETFRRDPDLDQLRNLPEFEEMVKELEKKIAKEKNV